jgi:hypothetical protein
MKGNRDVLNKKRVRVFVRERKCRCVSKREKVSVRERESVRKREREKERERRDKLGKRMTERYV